MTYDIYEIINVILIREENVVKIIIGKTVQGEMRSTFHSAKKDQSLCDSHHSWHTHGQEWID